MFVYVLCSNQTCVLSCVVGMRSAPLFPHYYHHHHHIIITIRTCLEWRCLCVYGTVCIHCSSYPLVSTSCVANSRSLHCCFPNVLLPILISTRFPNSLHPYPSRILDTSEVLMRCCHMFFTLDYLLPSTLRRCHMLCFPSPPTLQTQLHRAHCDVGNGD